MIARVILVTILVALAFVPDLAGQRGDFRPFEMTIEFWDADAGRHADGSVVSRTERYRLEYWDRANWTMTRVESRPDLVVEGRMCRAGIHHYYEPSRSGWQAFSDSTGLCNGVGRWVHWGIAWTYPWRRTPGPEPGQVTLTDPGERIVFDLRTGLPVLYEAGPVTGGVRSREIYRLERFLD